MTVAEYLETTRQALERVDPEPLERVADLLYRAFQDGRRVYTLGNGASAALASHVASDLAKNTAGDVGRGPSAPAGRRLRIVGLADNAASLTAIGNDVAYEDVFLEQLKNLLEPGDVVIGVSGSGGSPNVLRAMEYARLVGAVTVGLTGAMPKAEKLAVLCDLCVRAPSATIEVIEDLHVAYHHAIITALKARLTAQP